MDGSSPILEVRPGATLPGGHYRLGGDRHARLVAAVGGPPADGTAHPLSAWVIALGGCGVPIGDMFEAAGVPMEDGPMLGGCHLELERALQIETEYTVRGTITDVQEKSGRKIGRFGIMTLRIELAEPDGTLAAACTAAMILPRRGEAPA